MTMAESRKFQWLCSVIHYNDVGASFAVKVKEKLEEKYGKETPVKIEWHGVGQDKYGVIEKACSSSKFVIVVFTKNCTKDNWFSECWKQADRWLGNRGNCLKPIFVMVEPFTKDDLPDHIKNVHDPMTFQAMFGLHEKRWSELVKVVKPCDDIDPSGTGWRANSPAEKTMNDKWREFIERSSDQLIERLDPVNYINGLISAKLISFPQKEEIEAEKTRSKQNGAVLNIVISKQEKEIKAFIRLLEKKENWLFNDILKHMDEELRRDFDGLPPLHPQPSPPERHLSVPSECSDHTDNPSVTVPEDNSSNYSVEVSGDAKIHATEDQTESDIKEHRVGVEENDTDSKLKAGNTGNTPSRPTSPSNEELKSCSGCEETQAKDHIFCSKCGLSFNSGPSVGMLARCNYFPLCLLPATILGLALIFADKTGK